MALEIIQEFFAITDQLGDQEYECEARIQGYFVTEENCQYFINNNAFSLIEYQELKIKEGNITYRKRDNVPVCKSALFRKEYKDLWFTMNIASEICLEYNIDNKFANRQPCKVKRWSTIHSHNKIEIGCGSFGRYWVEIEKTNCSNPEDFLDTIKYVLKELQRSPNLVRYSDYIVLTQVYDTIPKAKPVTLSTKNINMLSKCKWISPKYDGVRVFLIIRMGRIFEIDLHGNIRYIRDIPLRDDILSILDCERVQDQYYIIDMPLYDTKGTAERLGLRERYREYFPPKPFYEFVSVDQVSDILSTDQIEKDGVIFMGDSYEKGIYKWKYHNTVDLLFKGGKLYTSDRKEVAKSQVQLKENKIYEFFYSSEHGHFVAIRERPDKPRANPLAIVLTNVNDAIPKEIFDGIGAYWMRKYHNRVKRELLKKYTGDYLLDIGTGQGGDIKKWKHFKKVCCIEKDDKLYQESITRGNQGIYIPKKLSDVSPQELPFDPTVITTFFCINLFDNQDMESLVDILKTKKVKYFMGICMTRFDDQDNSCFTIRKITGRKYIITVHGTKVINVVERIIKMEKIDNILLGLGYKKIESARLEDYGILSKNERLLSSCYEKFVYELI